MDGRRGLAVDGWMGFAKAFGKEMLLSQTLRATWLAGELVRAELWQDKGLEIARKPSKGGLSKFPIGNGHYGPNQWGIGSTQHFRIGAALNLPRACKGPHGVVARSEQTVLGWREPRSDSSSPPKWRPIPLASLECVLCSASWGLSQGVMPAQQVPTSGWPQCFWLKRRHLCSLAGLASTLKITFHHRKMSPSNSSILCCLPTGTWWERVPA